MSKGSSTKKKKTVSPGNPGKAMPKIPRTPQGQAAGQPPVQPAEDEVTTPQPEKQKERGAADAIEVLWVGMEGRFGTKIDSTNAKVDRALKTLEELEVRVGATEANSNKRIEEAEERIQVRVAGKSRPWFWTNCGM